MSGYEVRVVANPVFNAMATVVLPAQDAACSAGRVPIGGGYELVGTGQQLTVLASAPTSGGWRVIVKNTTSSTLMNAQVKVHVVCAVMQ